MNQTSKVKVRNLVIAAMLTALGILIPAIMPAKIIIGPASFTLASHVPVMAAMFFSPVMTAFVAIGTTIGFMISTPVPTIWLRAAMHIIVMTAGAYFLKKHPEIIHQKVKIQVFNVILGIFHAGLEAFIVYVFYAFGFATLDQHALFNFLLLIGFGGLVHSFIDFNLALGLCNVLSKAFPIDVFDRAKPFLLKNKIKAKS
ncbi:hypothetical protein [Lactococcus protaetiae]|uniref:Niacin transporter NiaX n=1 Tax=Lactococcus protaetiae TaxID=2592653 RepID=A0A514Z9J8_9LACT|nr:hypothetical protein [Lactococcus protaetiae]MCL2113991.1 hypothetical protein [Streptococcaceae bacterium]QDK71262.1 hypothetical protein FLP15_08965 [Lactococcus protaetiae]